MLWQEGFAAAEIKKQIAAAERMQRNQLPSVAPLLDGWDLAGWTAQAEALGGDFHDWFCLPDGLLAVAVGHAMDRRRAGGACRQRIEGGAPRPRAILSRGPADPEAAEPDALDRLSRRPARRAFLRAGRDCDRPRLRRFGGPARRAHYPPGPLGISHADHAAAGRGAGNALRTDGVRIAIRRNFGLVFRRRLGVARPRWQAAGRGSAWASFCSLCTIVPPRKWPSRSAGISINMQYPRWAGTEPCCW